MIFLEFSNIKKRLIWPDIKTKRIDVMVCFTKHTLGRNQIELARPKAQDQPSPAFFLFFLFF
jgi:hypothetical protein